MSFLKSIFTVCSEFILLSYVYFYFFKYFKFVNSKSLILKFSETESIEFRQILIKFTHFINPALAPIYSLFPLSDFKSPTNSANSSTTTAQRGRKQQRPSLPPSAMDDSDLDSAALWAAVDSAAARASRARSAATDDDHRGEVLQPVRSFKSPRLAIAAPHATPPPPSMTPTTRTHASPYATPDAAAAARGRLVVVESPPPEPWSVSMGSPIAAVSSDGCLLPSISVANFRKYQEVALSVRLSHPCSSPHPAPVKTYLFSRSLTICELIGP
jgi:hypothetical protein